MANLGNREAYIRPKWTFAVADLSFATYEPMLGHRVLNPTDVLTVHLGVF